MKTYWMFWTGYSANPLRQLSVTHWIGIVLGLLIFAGFCFAPQSLFDRVFISTAVIAPFWGYWVLRVKKIAGPANLLVPQLRQRLLKTSMAHWLVATLLLAFAATIREKLDHFFDVGFLMGCGLLAFAWLASLRNVWLATAGGIGMVCGIWLIAVFFRWNDHSSIAMVLLMLGWLVMPCLAWLTVNILLRDGVARHSRTDQFKKQVPGREMSFSYAIHHWFLRRMSRACTNTALRPEVLERVRLEARLNSSFGPEFHWSSYISELWTVIVLFSFVMQRSKIADGDFFAILLALSLGLLGYGVQKFMEKHRAAPSSWLSRGKFKTSLQMTNAHGFTHVVTPIDNSNARLMKGLLFLAPGLPQGLPLHQALARITLRYYLIVWAGYVAIYAVMVFGLPAPIRLHALVMIATAELAMVGRWVGSSPSNWAEPWELRWDRIPTFIWLPVTLVSVVIWPTSLAKYAWLLLAFAPDWYLESISLPLWTASCLLGGAAFLYLRWQKLASEPDGLPAGWR